MKIAFVHEYLNQFGGAERLLQVLCSIFPNAPIYTLFYDEIATGGVFKGREIRTSFLQNTPFVKGRHTLFPLLMPIAIEQFDFSEFDVVISISASFSKGIITPTHTTHICYCLTPPRFLWDDSHRFINEFPYPGPIKKIIPPLISYLRVWDSQAGHRVDKFWAISGFIQERIRKYYRQESSLLYCPVNVNLFHTSDVIGNYYLAVGRLVPYKQFDLIVKTFNQLSLPIKIVGTGPELKKLRSMAKDNIEFLGLVSDETLASLYASTKALIFPQEEDFGIVPLEAMASGRPVIAYRGGGAIETVAEGKTGFFFDRQTVEDLALAVSKFNDGHTVFSPVDCQNQANKFSIEVFRSNLLNLLNESRV